MSDRWTEPLEPAHLIGEAFAVISRHVAVMIGISLLVNVPLSLAAFAYGFFFGGVIAGIEAGDFSGLGSLGFLSAALAGGLVYMLGACLVYTAITQAASDDAAGRPVSFGASMATGWRQLLPVTGVVILTAILAIFAGLLFIVPGLYLMALWWLVIPAIVEERLGFDALGRSASLTEGYRWPMVGLILIYLLVAVGVGVITAIPEAVLLGFGIPGAVIAALIGALGDAFVSVIGATAALLAYNRLRQIKEGGDPSVAEVFT